MTGDRDEAALEETDGRPEIDDRYIVPGLSRGLAILQLFGRNRHELKLTELAEGVGLTRSAAYRLVYTLESEGYLSRDPVSRRYRLTSKILTLGFVFLHAQPLTELVYPYLRRLSEATRAAAHLVQLEGWQCVYLARVTPAVTLVTNLQIGTHLPAFATASGRVLLSGLDEERLRAVHQLMRREYREGPLPPFEVVRARAAQDRATGYVFKESMFDPGVLSFAAPVRDGSGHIIAAINAVGPRQLLESVGDAEAVNAIVGNEARTLSRSLGYAG